LQTAYTTKGIQAKEVFHQDPTKRIVERGAIKVKGRLVFDNLVQI